MSEEAYNLFWVIPLCILFWIIFICGYVRILVYTSQYWSNRCYILQVFLSLIVSFIALFISPITLIVGVIELFHILSARLSKNKITQNSRNYYELSGNNNNIQFQSVKVSVKDSRRSLPIQEQNTRSIYHEGLVDAVELTPMAGDLLLKLSSGARIYLSNTIALESVRYRNEVYAEVFGCTPDQRKVILEDKGLTVEISGKEHLLLPVTKVRTMSYILKSARVLNIYDMEIRDLEPTDSGVARLNDSDRAENKKIKTDSSVDFENISLKAEETPKPPIVLSKSAQQESSRRLKEYNKWLSQQEDFAEFSKWFMKKLRAKGLTREQLNMALKELVKKRGGNHEEAQKLIAKWYEQFHQARQKH